MSGWVPPQMSPREQAAWDAGVAERHGGQQPWAPGPAAAPAAQQPQLAFEAIPDDEDAPQLHLEKVAEDRLIRPMLMLQGAPHVIDLSPEQAEQFQALYGEIAQGRNISINLTDLSIIDEATGQETFYSIPKGGKEEADDLVKNLLSLRELFIKEGFLKRRLWPQPIEGVRSAYGARPFPRLHRQMLSGQQLYQELWHKVDDKGALTRLWIIAQEMRESFARALREVKRRIQQEVEADPQAHDILSKQGRLQRLAGVEEQLQQIDEFALLMQFAVPLLPQDERQREEIVTQLVKKGDCGWVWDRQGKPFQGHDEPLGPRYVKEMLISHLTDREDYVRGYRAHRIPESAPTMTHLLGRLAAELNGGEEVIPGHLPSLCVEDREAVTTALLAHLGVLNAQHGAAFDFDGIEETPEAYLNAYRAAIPDAPGPQSEPASEASGASTEPSSAAS